jgi:hypothetical protein
LETLTHGELLELKVGIELLSSRHWLGPQGLAGRTTAAAALR